MENKNEASVKQKESQKIYKIGKIKHDEGVYIESMRQLVEGTYINRQISFPETQLSSLYYKSCQNGRKNKS